MKKIVILGRNQFMMDKVLPILRSNGYDAIGFLIDKEIIYHISQNDVDAVLFGGGVEQVSREQIMNVPTATNRKLKFLNANPQTILSDLRKIFSI